MMKWVLLFVLIFMIASVSSQPKTYTESRYGKLEFGFFVPENLNPHKLYPLVIYLHGFGNNEYVYLDWYREDIQAKNPCFVFTPRTPVSWADWSGWNDKTLSAPMTATIHVLDSLCKVYPLDTNRLYIYGISMGGEGVFDLLHKLPGKFAAAMSVCGGGQTSWAENISKTPFWMFHGSDDDVNPPDLTERVYNGLVEIGATKMRYTNYSGFGHDIWDKAAAEPSWFDWMFSHTKTDTCCPEPNVPLKLAGNFNKQLELNWSDARVASNKANRIWYYQIYNRDKIVDTVDSDKTWYSFDSISATGSFRVVAVNYCFQKSEPSNELKFK